MFQEAIDKVCNSSKAKVDYLDQNKRGYFIASMLAGFYVGLGIFLIMTVGGITQNPQGTQKILMGVSFGIALSLVVMAGSELFTGNNFVMTVGGLNRSISFGDVIKLWFWNYFGNLAGAMFVGFLFVNSGAGSTTYNFLIDMAISKSSYPVSVLIFKAILCNILVCLSTICYTKMKEETGKLIMIFWCLYAFITSGYEHSVANMSLFTAAYLAPNSTLTMGAIVYNLVIVSLGNMVGGILLGVAYYFMGDKKTS